MQNGTAESTFPTESDYWTKEGIERFSNLVREKLSLTESPSVGIICGSGLGSLADDVLNPKIIKYKDIPGLPDTHVKGHKGQLVFGELEGKQVVCMQGRFHPYEGHDLTKCVLPVRIMKFLGCKILLVTNAAGGVNRNFQAGDLMAIKDHIAPPLMGLKGPLIGRNDEQVGPRFPSTNDLYDKELRQRITRIAEDLDIPLRVGIYWMCGGPQYETPAELRMVQRLGGDAVGMSVAHEAIAARHCGLRVFAMSLITNVCDLDEDAVKRDNLHEEVLEAARQATDKASKLVRGIVAQLET